MTSFGQTTRNHAGRGVIFRTPPPKFFGETNHAEKSVCFVDLSQKYHVKITGCGSILFFKARFSDQDSQGEIL